MNNMPQQFIVYRSPVEWAMWDFFTSANGFIFMVMAVVFIGVTAAVDNKISWYTKSKYPYLSLICGAISAGLILILMI